MNILLKDFTLNKINFNCPTTWPIKIFSSFDFINIRFQETSADPLLVVHCVLSISRLKVCFIRQRTIKLSFNRFRFAYDSDSQLPCKEYMSAIEELTSTINSKKYADVRGAGLEAADIVQRQLSDTGRTKENVCAVIRVFYKEHFLDTLEDVWIF